MQHGGSEPLRQQETLHRLRCLGAVLGVAPLQILGLGIDSFPTSSDGLGDGANGALGAPSLNSTAPMPLSALID